MEKSIMLKKWQVFQMRQIWLFCNVYSKEDGLQFGATIHRAKNMQYTTQESHWSCSMPQKKLLQKEHHIRKMSCLKSTKLRVAFFTKVTLAFCFVLFVCFFLPHLNSLQILFWHFWKWSHFSHISCVLNLSFLHETRSS